MIRLTILVRFCASVVTRKWKAGNGATDGNHLERFIDYVCYYWGPGISKCDSHLLHNTLSGNDCSTNWDAPLGSPRILWTKYGNSFIKELEERGYDLTTLRFYVRKKNA